MIRKSFLFFFALIFSIAIHAEPIKKIVIFGDSLTDNGNIYTFIKEWFHKQFPKSPPYGGDKDPLYPGRFSNGPIWSDLMESFFKQRYNIPTINYAVGGASVELLNPLEKNLPWTMNEEILDYLTQTAFTERKDVLFVIWIGANDYTGEPANIEKSTTSVTKSISATLDSMIKAHGARNFLILNLPDLGKIPRATMPSHDAKHLHDLAALHNAKLEAAINEIKEKRKDLNVRIATIDVFDIFNDLLADPDKFNKKYNTQLVETKDFCWKGGYSLLKMQSKQTEINELHKELKTLFIKNNFSLKKIDTNALAEFIINSPDLAAAYKVEKLYNAGITPCEKPQEYVFWDEVHPTTAVHSIFAQIAIQQIMDAGFLK